MALFQVCKLYNTPPSTIFDKISMDEYIFTVASISHENEVKYGKRT